jgi:hypothetical protein
MKTHRLRYDWENSLWRVTQVDGHHYVGTTLGVGTLWKRMNDPIAYKASWWQKIIFSLWWW